MHKTNGRKLILKLDQKVQVAEKKEENGHLLILELREISIFFRI